MKKFQKRGYMMNHLPSSWFNKTSSTSRIYVTKSFLCSKRTWFCKKNLQDETQHQAAFWRAIGQRNYKKYKFLRNQQPSLRSCQETHLTKKNDFHVQEIVVAYVSTYVLLSTFRKLMITQHDNMI